MSVASQSNRTLGSFDGEATNTDIISDWVDCVHTNNFRVYLALPATGTPVGYIKVQGSEDDGDSQILCTLTSDMLHELTGATLEADGTLLLDGTAFSVGINIGDPFGKMRVWYDSSSGGDAGAAATGKHGRRV